MRIIKRLCITFYCLVLKYAVLYAILLGINPNKNKSIEKNIIVSFTSYGIRLKKCTWLAAYSMLQQSTKPEKIILYLDYSFQSIKLPYPIRKLLKMGLEIAYCKDIRSYKKLIPALSMFPQKTIITIDDDIYYSKHLIKNLYETSIENPKSICANTAIEITLDEKKNPLPYTKWNRSISSHAHLLFAVGCGGILYPPNSLNMDLLAEKDFMSIAPNADDIWFFATRIKSGSHLALAKKYKIILHPVNYLYERLHRDAGLTEKNVHEGKNDIQFLETLKHFEITL